MPPLQHQSLSNHLSMYSCALECPWPAELPAMTANVFLTHSGLYVASSHKASLVETPHELCSCCCCCCLAVTANLNARSIQHRLVHHAKTVVADWGVMTDQVGLSRPQGCVPWWTKTRSTDVVCPKDCQVSGFKEGYNLGRAFPPTPHFSLC